MSNTKFYVASIVEGGKTGFMSPDERQDVRRHMSGVAIWVDRNARMSDPTFLVPDSGPTGHEVSTITRGSHEMFTLQVGPKTEHRDGQQYVRPADLAHVVFNMANDKKDGGCNRQPILDRVTGEVKFDWSTVVNGSVTLRQATRKLYELSEAESKPEGKDEKEWERRESRRLAERQRHFDSHPRLALCSRDIGGMGPHDIDLMTNLITEMTTKPAAPATTPTNKTSPSAFGGGVDPTAQATKSAFADVAAKSQLLLGYNPHNHAAVAKIVAQTPRGDQIVGAPWHRRDEWAGAAKGSFHPSFGYASRREVDEMIKAPAGPKLARMRGEILRRIEDEPRTEAELAGKRWDPVI